MGLRGDITKVSDIKRAINDLPRSVAHDVAQRAAPALTAMTREAYDGGRSVYGEARPASKVTGAALTLKKTGAVARQLGATVTGTVVRFVLGPKYSKYLIGKYGILPNGGLPAAWSEKLSELVKSFKVAP
jgi:hypothetical protein